MEFDLPTVCGLLANPIRVELIRELARGLPLPTAELARRLGIDPSHVSRHLGYLRAEGVTEFVHGRIHSLAPAFRPAPGAKVIDLRQILLVLEPEVKGEG